MAGRICYLPGETEHIMGYTICYEREAIGWCFGPNKAPVLCPDIRKMHIWRRLASGHVKNIANPHVSL